MRKLTLKRTFPASIKDVWRAWTDPEILKDWWSPPGMHCAFISANVSEDGRFLYCFKMDEGDTEYWGRGIYKTIIEPRRLTYLDSFTDKSGNDVPPSYYGLPGDAVVESLVEMNLKEDKNGTHLTMIMDNPYGGDDKLLKDMAEGWNGMLDKLAKILKG